MVSTRHIIIITAPKVQGMDIDVHDHSFRHYHTNVTYYATHPICARSVHPTPKKSPPAIRLVNAIHACISLHFSQLTPIYATQVYFSNVLLPLPPSMLYKRAMYVCVYVNYICKPSLPLHYHPITPQTSPTSSWVSSSPYLPLPVHLPRDLSSPPVLSSSDAVYSP